MKAGPRTAARSRGDSPRSVGWIPIALLLAVSYIGYFKATLLLRWLGFDPTAPLVLILAIYVLYRQLGHQQGGLHRWAPVLALWALFLPGAVYALSSGYNPYKTAYLFSITLISVLAASVVLQTETDLRRWIKGTIVAGLVVAAFSLIDPNLGYTETFGRLGIEGSSTIATARVIGAAFVSVVLLACVRQHRLRPILAVMSLLLGALLVSIGSRGPLLGAVLTIVVVLLSARLFRDSRWSSLFVGALGLGLVAFWAASMNIKGAQRTLGFLSGERIDVARNSLIGAATQNIENHPLGIGWGGFSLLMGDNSGSTHPHNLFLEVFLEGGWIAGVALVVFVVLALWRLWLASGSAVGAVTFALAIYWLAVAQTSSDINGNRITLVILACAFVLPKQAESSAPQTLKRRSFSGTTRLNTHGDYQISPHRAASEEGLGADVNRRMPAERRRRPN
ncbi:O-antigen ligase family protein [Dietzia sp. PP-33]|uniref:O-antigen ligase family protein n=1 Tax=Dietzia sp. PP-33 TaxID=2957500 RepID=UPI0029ABC1C9|nr:O-antigen ligase family protein [Dietzia sp. PP-33]MDX2358774.1 O-antigen ligase family protein [Dietzia sp. PP-33]